MILLNASNPLLVCFGWRNVTGIYSNGTTRCFRIQRRECEYCNRNTTEHKFVDARCPVKPSPTPSPTPSSTLTSIFTSEPMSLCSPSLTISHVTVTIKVTATETFSHVKTVVHPAVTQTVPCPSKSSSISAENSTMVTTPITKGIFNANDL